MPDLSIPFTDAQFREVAAEALAKGLTEKARDKIIMDAISAAMRPQGYGSTSLVEQAFKVAIEQVVKDIVRDAVAKDDAILERVRASTRQAIDQILASKNWSVSRMVATAITEALEKKDS